MGMSEIIQKMKVFLSNEIPAEEVQMTDVKTKDGIILSFEGELVSGIEIFVVDETGKNPCTDGEYILEDGQTIVVAEGKISEIKPTEEPIEDSETEEVIPVAEMPMAEEEPVVEKPKEEDDRIKKLEDEILQIKSILSELATEMGKTELKSEIKTELQLSKVNTIPQMRENNNIANSQLDNIFYNMYNKKL